MGALIWNFSSSVQLGISRVSTLFFLLYKHIKDRFLDDFPKIFENLPKIAKDSVKVVRRAYPTSRQTFPNVFPKASKITEAAFRSRTDDISRSYSTTSKHFLRDYVIIAMVIFPLVKITCTPESLKQCFKAFEKTPSLGPMFQPSN